MDFNKEFEGDPETLLKKIALSVKNGLYDTGASPREVIDDIKICLAELMASETDHLALHWLQGAYQLAIALSLEDVSIVSSEVERERGLHDILNEGTKSS